MVCRPVSEVGRPDDFNRLAWLHAAFRDHLAIATGLAAHRCFQLGVDCIEHVARRAEFGDLQFHAAGKLQSVADLQVVGIETDARQVFAGRSSDQVIALFAQLINHFTIENADGLERSTMFLVIVAIADQPCGCDVDGWLGELGNATG